MEDNAPMKQANHTPRTLKLLRSRGYICDTVEKWKRFPDRKKEPCAHCGNTPLIGVRVDLFGFADLIAIRACQVNADNHPVEVAFVQVTSASNHAARRNKILASSEAKLCILAGCSILIQSWKKVQNRFQAHDEWITVDQFVQGLPDTVEQFYTDQARLNLLDRKKRLPALPPGSTLPLSAEIRKRRRSRSAVAASRSACR